MPKTDTAITRDSFVPELYDLYWRMIVERQYMYVRRAYLGQDRPWTKDQFLNAEFITNMYRQMDPGTEYLITQILSLPNEVDRLFNVMLYRLMGSQSHVHEKIKLTAKQFTKAKFMKALADVEKPFGDSYRVAGYESEGGATKLENVAIMFDRLAKTMPDLLATVKAVTSPAELYQAIFEVPGFGEFLAHQISVDLLYKNPAGQAISPFGENTWAMAGPGARRGVWAMLKPGVKPRSMMDVMEFLRDAQEAEFAERGLTFPYLADEDGNAVPLSLCNIQSTLCEFFKYVRLWDGSTRKVRSYIPAQSSTLTRFPLSLTDEQIEAIGQADQVTPDPAPYRAAKASESIAAEVSDAVEPQPEAEPDQTPSEDLGAAGDASVAGVVESIELPANANRGPITITINIYTG